MKNTSNVVLRFALDRANRIRSYLGLPQFNVGKIRSDWSPTDNLKALNREIGLGRFELCNDINSGTRSTGIVTRLGDAAIARFILVQKGASAPNTNVAKAQTSGTPIGITLDAIADTSTVGAIQLLACGVGTVRATSDSSAAIAAGDLLTFINDGFVKTYAGTTGQYVLVGQAVESCANGATGTDKEFEMAPMLCFRHIP